MRALRLSLVAAPIAALWLGQAVAAVALTLGWLLTVAGEELSWRLLAWARQERSVD